MLVSVPEVFLGRLWLLLPLLLSFSVFSVGQFITPNISDNPAPLLDAVVDHPADCICLHNDGLFILSVPVAAVPLGRLWLPKLCFSTRLLAAVKQLHVGTAFYAF
jgi:hypothetical protein